METITWDDFSRVELRVGRVVAAEVFARRASPRTSCRWISAPASG